MAEAGSESPILVEAPIPQEWLTGITPISRGCYLRLLVRTDVVVVLLVEILTLSMQKCWVYSKSFENSLPSIFSSVCGRPLKEQLLFLMWRLQLMYGKSDQ